MKHTKKKHHKQKYTRKHKIKRKFRKKQQSRKKRQFKKKRQSRKKRGGVIPSSFAVPEKQTSLEFFSHKGQYISNPETALFDGLPIYILPLLKEIGSGQKLGWTCDYNPRTRKWNDLGGGMFEANNCLGYIVNVKKNDNTQHYIVDKLVNGSSPQMQLLWTNSMNGMMGNNGDLPGLPVNSLTPGYVPGYKLPFQFNLVKKCPISTSAQQQKYDLLSWIFNDKGGKGFVRATKEDFNVVITGHHNQMKLAFFNENITLGNGCCIKLSIPSGNPPTITVIVEGQDEKKGSSGRAGLFTNDSVHKESICQEWKSVRDQLFSDIEGNLEHPDNMSYEMFKSTPNYNINIYFIRHGQTLHNVTDKKCKYKFIDNPLTPHGIKQARMCGIQLALSHKEFSRFTTENTLLCTSLLTRTTDTFFYMLDAACKVIINHNPWGTWQQGKEKSLFSVEKSKLYEKICDVRKDFNVNRLKLLIDDDNTVEQCGIVPKEWWRDSDTDTLYKMLYDSCDMKSLQHVIDGIVHDRDIGHNVTEVAAHGQRPSDVEAALNMTQEDAAIESGIDKASKLLEQGGAEEMKVNETVKQVPDDEVHEGEVHEGEVHEGEVHEGEVHEGEVGDAPPPVVKKKKWWKRW